jgi:hypothetical protein
VNIAGVKNYFTGGTLAVVVALAGCAPQRPYRPPPLPPSRGAPMPPPAPLPLPPPASTESFKSSLPQDADIREQNLKSRTLPPPPLAIEPVVPPVGSEYVTVPPESGLLPPPPLPDDSSLLAKITPGVTPQRAASLRLTDEGSKLLEAGETAKALNRLERTIVIDSTNPYGYFYLAKAHHKLGRHKESLNFLDVAESRLLGEAYWIAEVYALRGENFRALGMSERAEASYSKALSINPGNRTAAEAMSRPQGSPVAAPR